MSRYTVRLLAQVAREVTVEAETPAEAVRLAREQEPKLVGVALDAATLDALGFGGIGQRLKPDQVAALGEPDEDGAPIVLDEWQITSGCESCDVPLFESDDYYSGEVDLCATCAKQAAAEDAGADEEPVETGGAA